jgi:undecaprenyl-diphosphatase
MHGTVADLVASYGYVFLFLLVGIESFGIPLPGETALVVAAALAAQGRLNIWLVIASAAAGAILGDNAGYWLGRKGGIALVTRYGKKVGLTEAKLAQVHAFFERHGAKTVFIGRFVALLRSWAAALAGVARMSYGVFTLYNAIGGVTWAALLGALGVSVYLGGRWFRQNGDRIGALVSARWRELASSPRFTGIRARHQRLWSFVAARFASGEYLGLHLTLGFAVSVGALWVFGGVTEDVIHHDPLTAVDVQAAAWLRAHASPVGDRISVIVTTLGSPVLLAAIAIIVALVLVRRRWWIVLTGWIAAFTGGGALDWALKHVIHRPRPTGATTFLYGASFSFPSGHAMGSLIGYGMLAYLLIAYWPWARRHSVAVTVFTFLLILAIGLSRLYLGVHFLSDVIGGYAAGAVWLTACITGIEIALRQRGLAPWDVGLERRNVPRVPGTV